jgi:hypothetical protein
MKKNSNNLSKPSKTIIAGIIDPALRSIVRRAMVDAESAERRAKMSKAKTPREVGAPSE